MSSDDRRLDVLRAIVEDFVSTSEPVGSKAIAERYHLGVSPATIRNDMAALEDEGLIAQPHTSAGRVPTDKGYRLFVDRLSGVRPLSTAERRAIHSFLDNAVDLDDVVARTVRLLSQLTHQVALVQYPSLSRSSVRHIELVLIAPTRILMVLIADTGRVEQRLLTCAEGIAADVVADLRARLGAALEGRPFAEVGTALTPIIDAFTGPERAFVTALADVIGEAVTEQSEERILVAGAANLARYGEDFSRSVHPVLEALEEQVVLLRLLSEADSDDRISVRIGHEVKIDGMSETSVLTTGYGSAGHEGVGRLGVIGPTRMDYVGNITAVRAVARYLGRILAEQ